MSPTQSTYRPWHVRLFDGMERRWASATMRRGLAWSLVGAFFVSVACIELSRQGILPSILGHPLPVNHLAAISWVITLLLIFEVLDLVFGLAKSVASSLGMQLEVFSLILLRKAFDELPHLPEPISLSGELSTVLRMGSLGLAALVVFAVLIPYGRLQRHAPISKDPEDVERFVRLKKAVCLGLLLAFVVTGAFFGVGDLTVDRSDGILSLDFFKVFYTILIFADVLIVLASLTVTREFRIVFRNFAFALVTVFLRLALTAEAYTEALLGTGTALFALAVAYLFEKSRPKEAATGDGEARPSRSE